MVRFLILRLKFVKKYANVGEIMKDAFSAYIEDVKQGAFPEKKHEYDIADEVIEKVILIEKRKRKCRL